MKVSELLLIARFEQGYTQESLGEAIGVPNKKVSKWELGEFDPTLHELRLLSNFFETPIKDLVKSDELNFDESDLEKFEEFDIYDLSGSILYLVGVILVYLLISLFMITNLMLCLIIFFLVTFFMSAMWIILNIEYIIFLLFEEISTTSD